jgi:aryl-alcohol dehydrogenase-like predicted oxidoreductase
VSITYRLSIDDPEHYEVLKLALEKGCHLIDTSSNYMDGKSEELIGKVLKENPQYSPTIVTKGGFFGPQDKEEIEKSYGDDPDIFQIKKDFFYSLGEKALEYQITKSLDRLNANALDVFLIHNPETYFLKESVDEETICKKI